MADVAELQDRMVALVRAFGLLRDDRTPCGQPIGPSVAHALGELHADEPLPPGVLAARLRLDRSTVSRLVDRLERSGWVSIARDPLDGRGRLLHLTPAGRAVADRLTAARSERYAQLYAAIPPSERETVQRALTLLLTAVEATDEERSDDQALAGGRTGAHVRDELRSGG